jgi:hypothetical protein
MNRNMTGFSKLPEKVQKKMSPKLAKKYSGGGKVKVRGTGAATKGLYARGPMA